MAKKKDAPDTERTPVTSYKGFDKDLKCRGFQYEVGKEYSHEGKVKACESGFHACEHPLAVLRHYAPAGSRFAVVEQSGETSRDCDDTKIASEKIKIVGEIGIPRLVKAAIEYTFKRAKDEGRQHEESESGAASATGTSGAASATGWSGAASATGERGAASATGTRGAASATGWSGAASATGESGAASATGTSGAASATGWSGAAMSIGFYGRVMGTEGNALFLVERNDDGSIAHACSAIVGRNGIKPNTWYTLNNGEFTEVSE